MNFDIMERKLKLVWRPNPEANKTMAKSWTCNQMLRYLTVLLTASLLPSSFSNHVVSGSPPNFIKEPQDTVIFAYDAAGNNASLSLSCIAAGDPSPNIAWYREEQPLANEVVMADGSLLIENIVEGVDATQDGLLYHCTANNTFGIIRSTAANVSYAFFNGFDGPVGIEVVNVSAGDNGNVALECRVGYANPSPQIEWFDGNGTLTEVATNNTLRFLDNGRYLLIRWLTAPQTSTNYYHCEVINARLHERVRSPTTYNLDFNLGRDDVMVYKKFENKVTFVDENVELSFIAGAGSAVEPFGLQSCQRSGSTLTIPLDLISIGGIIAESIPSTMYNEQLPAVAESVSFEVSCNFVAGTSSTPVQATLTLHAPPIIVMQPLNELQQVVGGSVMFSCEISGIPTPNVTWYFNGEKLSTGSGISINKNILTISSLAEEHSGMYQCFVSNLIDGVQASWAVQASTPVLPVVQSSSAGIAVQDRDVGPLRVVPNGEVVTLFALVTAYPCPTIQWRQNRNSIRQSDVYTISDPCPPDGSPGSTFYNFTLNITVTIGTVGNYTARLINAAGVVNVEGVFVTQPVPVMVTGIQFLSSPPCLLNGTSVIIRCVASGFPRPQITFNRGTMPITLGVGTFNNFVQLDYDTLNLTFVRRDDQGAYSCTARDRHTGLSHSPNKELLFCTQPTIVDLQVPEILTEGERNVTLMCSFTGIPAPIVHWEKDEEVFTPERSRQVNSSYFLSQLEIGLLTLPNAGEYTCVVTNVAGTVLRSRFLTVEAQTPPTLLSTEALAGIGAGIGGSIILIAVVVILALCYYAVQVTKVSTKYSPADSATAHEQIELKEKDHEDKEDEHTDGQTKESGTLL